MSVDFLSPVASKVPYKTNQTDGDTEMEFTDERIAGLHLVTPGETITTDTHYMRGHGTQVEGEGAVLASVAGIVERVNKLISVRPVRARYTGEIGDIVVGRITEVAQKRWKVDVNSRQDGVLLLSSINLPGGVQRRKSESDELQMRSFFAEGDLVAAEVQNFFADGAISLHTRSLKYAKLRNGSFVRVPAQLVQRTKTHFVQLPCGVDLVLGLNGYIWVAKHVKVGDGGEIPDPEMLYSNKNEPISLQERENIARVSNCITALARKGMYINDTAIVYTFDASMNFPIKDLLKLDVIDAITTEAREKTM